MEHSAWTETRGRATSARTIQIQSSSLRRKCSVFSGLHGVQELFHIEEDFEDAILVDLKLTGKLIDQKWQMVLAHRPRQNWNNMWKGPNRLTIGRSNKDQWKQALVAFREFCTPSKRARDDEAVKYLQSDAVRETPRITCQAHTASTLTCCVRASLLRRGK